MLSWSSSNDGPVGTGRSVSACFGTSGPRVITVTATDSNGGTSQRSVTVYGDNVAPKVTITTPATNGTTAWKGSPTNFEGLASARWWAVDASPREVVTGWDDAAVTLDAIVRAAFPRGSITGSPKVRGCQIIAELEGKTRGAYCGSIGWLEPRGAAGLDVAIRPGVVRGRDVHVHAGGGIVAESDPEREIAEGRLKLDTWRRVGR